MNCKYLFSSAAGDIALDSETLRQPFLLSPAKRHASLTLADYFAAINNFIWQDNGKLLAALLSDQLNQQITPADINEIVIRSEKHGALYHIASVEILPHQARPCTFAVTSAVTDRGRRCLVNEYEILHSLHKAFGLPYLPRVYRLGRQVYPAATATETFTMVLGEWFTDYHEWHLALDAKGQKRIRLWDLQRGNRFLANEVGLELCRQAAKILTLYYDPQNFRQIWPWHHAAGDFVVKEERGRIDVKLITARNYVPLLALQQKDQAGRTTAVLAFFLSLTLNMRLDRMDGVAEVVWLDEFALAGAVKGFFEALQNKAGGQNDPGRPADLLALLQTFTSEEYQQLYAQLLTCISSDGEQEAAIIQRRLPRHTEQLCRVIQAFRL